MSELDSAWKNGLVYNINMDQLKNSLNRPQSITFYSLQVSIY
jgi:hypothetical protein